MSDNKLQKVTGGNLGQKLLEAANYVTGDLFKFQENAGEDAEPVPQHRAIASIAKSTSSALVTVPDLYNAICNFSKQWSNSKKKKMPKSSMETFFKVLRMIGNYRFLLILSIVLAAVTVVLQLYVPILFGNAIDEVIGAHAVDFERGLDHGKVSFRRGAEKTFRRAESDK
mgnify:CR=1 FL=1